MLSEELSTDMVCLSSAGEAWRVPEAEARSQETGSGEITLMQYRTE